jgi:predicted transcriptional regulator
LEDGLRQRLLEIAAVRSKGETLSDIVRLALNEFISPDSVSSQETHFIKVTSGCKRRAAELARELNRSQTQVLEDCVEGIHDILESQQTPLILYEVRLRRKYHQKESPETVLDSVGDTPSDRGGIGP